MSRAIPPARVHILLARQARTGLILRRGPSKAVCAIGWDRKTDTFTVGQWLRGRIHERRCDLSPDGRHFLYLALNGRRGSETGGVWTAISRTPHLRAIGLWRPIGSWAGYCCSDGGGLFLDDHTYWLNANGAGLKALRVPSTLTREEEFGIPPALIRDHSFPVQDCFRGEFPDTYHLRLQRDGWKLIRHRRGQGGDWCFTFEKELPNGWILRKAAHTENDLLCETGVTRETHSLHEGDRPVDVECADWEWADLDGRRLVWVAKGVLHTAGFGTARLIRPRQLHDFNPLTFEAIKAPY